MKVYPKFLPSWLLAFSSITLSVFLIKQSSEAQGIQEIFISNLLPGKCIDVAGAPSISNGARLQLWDCQLSGRNLDNGSDRDQRWVFVD